MRMRAQFYVSAGKHQAAPLDSPNDRGRTNV